MRFFLDVVAVSLALLSSPTLCITDAFSPKTRPINRTGWLPARGGGKLSDSCSTLKMATTVIDVPTKPIAGMKPGTSGLRKKVEIWQGTKEEDKHYVENFIQSLLVRSFIFSAVFLFRYG